MPAAPQWHDQPRWALSPFLERDRFTVSTSLKHGVHSGATFQKKSLNQVSSSLSGFRRRGERCHPAMDSDPSPEQSLLPTECPCHGPKTWAPWAILPEHTRPTGCMADTFHEDCLFRAGPTGRKMQVWKVNYHKQASISKSLISVPEMDIWDTMQRKGKLTEPLARKKNSLSLSQNHIHLFWIYCRNTCSGNEFMPVVL